MTQSGIRYGQRLQTRENDIDAKIKLCNHIRRKYNLVPLRDWYLVFNAGKLEGISKTIPRDIGRDKVFRNPDIITYSQIGLLIIELDGSVHRYHEQRTADRNRLYADAGIKYIVLNTKDVIKEFDGNFARILETPGLRPPEFA